MVTDFIYDNLKLSDFGYAIVSFDGSKQDEIDTDSQLSFNHISIFSGKRQPYITATYEDPLKMEIYIAKNLCINGSNIVSKNNYTISQRDMAFLKRWLVRHTPHKLTITGSEYQNIYWMGSFNIEEFVFGDGRVGAHLTFECDAPFGYMENVTFSGSLNANSSYSFNCVSDEIGWIAPNLQIKVLSDGDLEIRNSSDGRITKIDNCTQGEIITIDKNLQISSSIQSHKILDDFNFVFYRIVNSFASVVNTIESNLPIEYTITYTPYAKVVIV